MFLIYPKYNLYQNETANSQTHFCLYHMGSEMPTFRARAIYFWQLSIESPCRVQHSKFPTVLRVGSLDKVWFSDCGLKKDLYCRVNKTIFPERYWYNSKRKLFWPLVGKAKMGSRTIFLFNSAENCEKISQTHFGFTNKGSEKLRFGVIAILSGKNGLAHPVHHIYFIVNQECLHISYLQWT